MTDAQGTNDTIVLRSPSAEFPAWPSFSLTVPATWRPEPTTNAALLAWDTLAPPHFRTNVLVTVERVRAGAPLTDAVRHLAQEASSTYPDYRVLTTRKGPVGGQPAALRLHTFTPRGAAAAVFQLQALLYAPAPEQQPTRDFVQLHATCSGELAATYAPAFEQMVSSFAFT